jgi:hypothetical protein
MPRKLLIVNTLLIAIAAGSAVFVARQLAAPMPMAPAKNRPPATTSPPPRAEAPLPSPGPGAYTAVAARNLFSPSRSEAPATATAGSLSPAVKPNLFGVVLREGAPIAYLEDPSTKRVAGYRVGDSVAGGTVQTISADSVVITRPDGTLDVRLRDPARPRPAPIPAAAIAPGAAGGRPGAAASLPGVIPPVATPGAPPAGVVPQQPGLIQQPGPGLQQPTPGIFPGRRPLPPNLLRRLPQGAPPNAPQR